MKRFLACTGALGVTLILGSCGSFNNSFNTYPITFTKGPVPDKDTPETTPITTNNNGPITPPTGAIPPVSPNTIDTGTKTIEATIHPCPVDPFPPMAKTPDIPFAELRAAGTDKVKIEQVERKHIEDLRNYISILKRTQTKAKLEFVAKCNMSAKQ